MNFVKIATNTVVLVGAVLLQACTSHISPDGTPSTGASIDAHVLGVGVDASVGIHPVGGVVGAGGARGWGSPVQQMPGAAVMGVITSPAVEELQSLTSCGGEGLERLRSRTRASESGRGASYNIDASRDGQCDRFGGDILLPRGMQRNNQSSGVNYGN